MKVVIDLTGPEELARERKILRAAIQRAERETGLPESLISRDVLMIYWAAEAEAWDKAS